MKKRCAIGLVVLTTLVLSSCVTGKFDRDLLQADGLELSPKLPNLEILSAESVQVGASKQLSSNSYLYTIFRREVGSNICDTGGEPKGSIEMELIFAEARQNPGWSSVCEAMMEFEVNIYSQEMKKVWNSVYSADYKHKDFGLAWQLSYSEEVATTALTILEHQLLEQLKFDLQADYNKIVNALDR